MSYVLTTMSDADDFIAKHFDADTWKVQVCEERCFGSGACLDLGRIELKPADSSGEARQMAVSRGEFEWLLPDVETVLSGICQLLGPDKPTAGGSDKTSEKALDRIRRTLDGVAAIAWRLGLSHPIFDARSVEEMPYARPITIVADTSAVVQGGLDFVARFLHPAARIKVPAVVHMEIVNQAERFLRLRRDTKPNKAAELLEHVLSQGGQRVLLRLELGSDTEIERNPMFGDPLRNAFRSDTEREWSELNLSVPLRNYCDRLILETARQQQTAVNPGHAVRLLTSDQGLARMALAEGIRPIFFRSVSSGDLFGRRLAGTNFDPFKGDLYHVSISQVLWELATAFGIAKLVSADGRRIFEVAAIGDTITWSPFHSHDDLLWSKFCGKGATAPPSEALLREGGMPELPQAQDESGLSYPGTTTAAAEPQRTAFYRFNVDTMFKIIALLASGGTCSGSDARTIAGGISTGSITEYRKFLASGRMIEESDDKWLATDRLYGLWNALVSMDTLGLAEMLNFVPSFSEFLRRLGAAGGIAKGSTPPIPTKAVPTYESLTEISCLGASVEGEGFFLTPNNPTPENFALLALQRFLEVAGEERWASTGAWLEQLVLRDRIHPVNARTRLYEASGAGLLLVSTEGSTLDTKYDRHFLHVLSVDEGLPRATIVHLYRGDFLTPNRSSSSIRLEEIHE